MTVVTSFKGVVFIESTINEWCLGENTKGNDRWRFYCTHCSDFQTWYSAFISISLLYL